MSSEGEDKAADWSGALQGAISEAGDEEDPSGIDVVSSGGLSGSSAGAESDNGELPYVVLLHAAARTVQSGEITVEEFIEGIGKLDAIADNALKIYAIPAVKNDLPGKLTDYQNSIVSALEVELHNLKKGLALMLTYPESKAVGDLEAGLKIAVASLNASNEIKKKADAERAAILQREQDEKAVRAQKAAQADSD
ncbi:MAG: hypothetical protein AMXMBFR33_44900 [Candidatus Xenobia bacterium]|jgi:hypothetical protein